MFSKRSLEGYLQIDHRNGPGLSSDEMRKIGWPGPVVGGGVNFEAPTLECCHCGSQFVVNPLRTRPRNHCRKCDRYVCDSPACNVECKPFIQTLDDLQEKAFRLST